MTSDAVPPNTVLARTMSAAAFSVSEPALSITMLLPTSFDALAVRFIPFTFDTSGADGNIDTFVFPGNITTIFTSLGVLYPDLSPTQRTGIRIDYQVEPTISSVKENKDVVLEKGILVARELIEKPN